MVVTGASRSVAVKLFYDLGFRNPLFVTILYLTGQGLSLIVYLVSRRSSPPPARRRPRYKKVSIELPTRHVVPNPMHSTDDECPGEMEDEVKAHVVEEKTSETPQRRRSGSPTGLTTESHHAATVTWVHAIPWYLKPAVPGFFNLCNSAMRWGSLIYVAASMAEMLISGLELLLSVVAARCIRKRRISWSRWVGVLVVALGLVLVRLANRDSVDEEHSWIGDVLIVGQCVMSVIQDMSEAVWKSTCSSRRSHGNDIAWDA
jgi:drug/metabolite transporter (DMT)-like permease